MNYYYIETRLGSPRADCAHFGVCETGAMAIEQWKAYQPYHPRKAKAAISFNGKDLIFSFPADGMTPEARDHFFSGPHFRVDSPKYLSAEICAFFGQTEMVVPVGLFPCALNDEGAYVLCFPQAAALAASRAEGAKPALSAICLCLGAAL